MNRSGKITRKSAVSHNLNDYDVPTQDTWEAAQNTQSGKFGSTDWANIISAGGDAIGSALAAIFGKGTTNNTYVTTKADDTKKDNTALYVGIGAGALVLVLILVLALKK